jgi:hypothetical protein
MYTQIPLSCQYNFKRISYIKSSISTSRSSSFTRVETVITRELIVPIAENVSCLAFGIDDTDDGNDSGEVLAVTANASLLSTG